MTTRRNVVARGLALLAGLVGAGAAGRELGRSGGGGATLVLHAVDLTRAPRRPAARGERATLVAELLDAPDGRAVGRLYGAGFALRGPGEPAGPDRLELHTFELAAGTLVGSGAAGLEEGAFAILGGTGSYAGARGTYSVRRPDGGAAEIVVSLL
jgi:hypothetical protein